MIDVFFLFSWRGLDFSPASAAVGTPEPGANLQPWQPGCFRGRGGDGWLSFPQRASDVHKMYADFSGRPERWSPCTRQLFPPRPPDAPARFSVLPARTRSHSHVLESWERCGLPQPQELEDACETAASLVHLKEVEPHFWVWEDTGFERSWLSYPELGRWVWSAQEGLRALIKMEFYSSKVRGELTVRVRVAILSQSYVMSVLPLPGMIAIKK